MKVIIPAAGYGTRMRPHTHTRPKPLVPVAGRPSLAFVLDALEPLPIEEIIFIVGKMGEQMEEYVNKHYKYKTRFIEQKVMRGQADAIALAREYVQGDLLTLFVDTLFEANLDPLKNLPDADGAMYVAEVPDPSRFGIAVVGPDGYVTKMVEKPKEPESNLAVVGLYYYKDSKWLFKAIDKLMASGRSLNGEYFLADAIQVMIEEGAKFKTFPVQVWEDTGTWDAVLHANRYLLRGMDTHAEPYMRGNSLVVPPSYISEQATIEKSIIGPYAAVSEEATIRDSIVKNSIVSCKATIEGAMLFGALVGERAVVQGSYQALNLGDDSKAHLIEASNAIVDETFK
ncbi:MAG: NTP transferase domain-containing protein [Chloroflexi bacterium]|nr:NTP transferase domain-containing protein [Chloroflexota bacterium]